MKTPRLAVFYALTAALFYGMSAPFSKLLLTRLSPSFLAALLYLGAGLGMACVYGCQHCAHSCAEQPLERKDLPYLTAMVLLDIAAPVLLLFGLKTTTPATVSLLNNFEIAATALVAGVWFKEKVGRRMWSAIGLITAACILLTVEDFSALAFSGGAVLALLASLCWGFENNTTRVLSGKNPVQTVSAARTGVYYAFAPFMGVGLSFVLVGQPLGFSFCSALALMLAGTYLAVTEKRPNP